MHDVDVRLILIVHFIQNHLVFIRKLIYFKIHGIMRCKTQVKTNNGKSGKNIWAILIRKILEQRRSACVLRFVHYA